MNKSQLNCSIVMSLWLWGYRKEDRLAFIGAPIDWEFATRSGLIHSGQPTMLTTVFASKTRNPRCMG